MKIDKFFKKKTLRKILLKRALSLSDREIKRRSENVKKTLSNLPIYINSKVIMGYFPLRGEIDILGMMQEALRQNKKVCLPVIDLENRNLYPYEVRNFDEDFSIGPFGIKQPDIRKCKKVDIKEIDLILIPGLGFDYKKNRLGRGGGFYDYFLKQVNRATVKVGIAFDFQVLNCLPIHTQLDQKVSILVSERFII